MSMQQPEIHAASIVIAGGFTPALFQPQWLAAKGLITEGEANAAKIEVIHSEVTSISTEWLELRVTSDRLHAMTVLTPYFEILRDLVAGILKLVPEMPFRAVGLNQTYHFKLPSTEVWH